MKNLLFKCATSFASLALVFATVGANVTCSFIAHQPEQPEEMKSLRKF